METLKFIMLVGLPASGKSTFVKEWRLGEAVVSSDDYIETEATAAGKTYDEFFSPEIYKEAENYMNVVFENAIKDKNSIIWDQTNLSVKKRMSVLKRVPAEYTKIAVVFETPSSEEWNRRLNSRPGKTIPKHVLDSMLTNFVYPSLDEGFDKIIPFE